MAERERALETGLAQSVDGAPVGGRPKDDRVRCENLFHDGQPVILQLAAIVSRAGHASLAAYDGEP